MKMQEKYTVKTTSISTTPWCWNKLHVDIFCNERKIGQYERNYSSLYNTFYPFKMNGREYALYSHDYQTVSIMSLPDCNFIAEDASGFCPVDFSYPDEEDTEYYQLEENDFMGKFAIVAGCVWGDDSGGWKLAIVDMSKLNDKIIKVNFDMMGYVESCYFGKLDNSLTWSLEDRFHRVSLPLMANFQVDEKNIGNSGFLGYSMEGVKPYTGKSWDNFKVVKTYNRDTKKSVEI